MAPPEWVWNTSTLLVDLLPVHVLSNFFIAILEISHAGETDDVQIVIHVYYQWY